VSTVLGLLAFVLYVVAIIGIAAAVTWLVVRLTPSRNQSGSARS
jgi:flagellar biogenesis protein FliO